MKKLLSIAVIILSLNVNSSLAKTKGSYAQINILKTSFSDLDYYEKKHENSDLGVGVELKHAFNFNNFYFAPAIFYNHNGTKLEFRDADDDTYQDEYKYSYGIKSDFGYDINNKISIFSIFGYSRNKIETSYTIFYQYGGRQHLDIEKSSYNEKALILGGGLKYSLNDKFDLQASYEYFNYIDKNISNSINPKVVKLGFAYNF